MAGRQTLNKWVGKGDLLPTFNKSSSSSTHPSIRAPRSLNVTVIVVDENRPAGNSNEKDKTSPLVLTTVRGFYDALTEIVRQTITSNGPVEMISGTSTVMKQAAREIVCAFGRELPDSQLLLPSVQQAADGKRIANLILGGAVPEIGDQRVAASGLAQRGKPAARYFVVCGPEAVLPLVQTIFPDSEINAPRDHGMIYTISRAGKARAPFQIRFNPAEPATGEPLPRGKKKGGAPMANISAASL